ncbi:MAG TPA: NUDIX domain-containing protein [Solirubrobacteraceae bacterium]|nr:NUDIX domain-containing protein [Solirubrobacteraceae bacterium]
MSPAPPAPTAPEPEFSAGGVVVRGDEVVVIVPTRRGAGGIRVLALPKGHPETGESPAQGALREVREEAGVSGEVIESLGVVEYRYERRRRRIAKRVEFFLIEYREGDPADHDHEVEQARWMPLREAATALTYPGEREIIARALSRRAPGR